MVINEGPVKDFVNTVKNKYDYYMGKRSSKYDFDLDLEDKRDIDELLDASPLKDIYKNFSNKVYQRLGAEFARNGSILRLTFDAREAPKELAQQINPKDKDSLYKYVTDYSKGSHNFTMELPIDKEKAQKFWDNYDKEHPEETKSKGDRDKAPTQDDEEEYQEYTESLKVQESLDLDYKMYFTDEDVKEFQDKVCKEVSEKTGIESLRPFNFYLSDSDEMTVVLEDDGMVYPVKVSINPMDARQDKGIFRYLDQAVYALVDYINNYRDLFDMELKVEESLAETVRDDFSEWSGTITFNAYKTLNDMRKYLGNHPECRDEMHNLCQQLSGIYSHARMESLKEASYGGAFDILDDEYFTRDDLNELSEYIEDELNSNIVGDKVVVESSYIDDQVLSLEISTQESGFLETFEKKIDMRRIKTPHDLTKVYGRLAVEDLKDKLESDGVEFKI